MLQAVSRLSSVEIAGWVKVDVWATEFWWEEKGEGRGELTVGTQ